MTESPESAAPAQSAGGQAARSEQDAERGSLEVRARALEHLAEKAANDVPGTVSVSGGVARLRGRDYPAVKVRVHGPRAFFEVDVAGTWPCPVAELTRLVRDRVRGDVARLSGMDVIRVDVRLHIINPDAGDQPARRRVS